VEKGWRTCRKSTNLLVRRDALAGHVVGCRSAAVACSPGALSSLFHSIPQSKSKGEEEEKRKKERKAKAKR